MVTTDDKEEGGKKECDSNDFFFNISNSDLQTCRPGTNVLCCSVATCVHLCTWIE